MNFNNARIREKGKKRNLFDKVNEIKEHIKTFFPEIGSDKILAIMSHCRRFYEGNLHDGRDSCSKKPRPLSHNERLIYSYLRKNNLNPSTVYRWFLAARIPADIRSQLARGVISQKKAFQLSANRLRNRISREGLFMMEEIRQIIKNY